MATILSIEDHIMTIAEVYFGHDMAIPWPKYLSVRPYERSLASFSTCNPNFLPVFECTRIRSLVVRDPMKYYYLQRILLKIWS